MAHNLVIIHPHAAAWQERLQHSELPSRAKRFKLHIWHCNFKTHLRYRPGLPNFRKPIELTDTTPEADDQRNLLKVFCSNSL